MCLFEQARVVPSSWRLELNVAGLLLAVGVVGFAFVWFFGLAPKMLVVDDLASISQVALNDFVDIAFRKIPTDKYRPLLRAALEVLQYFFGGSAEMYAAFNILGYAVVCLLLFMLIGTLTSDRVVQFSVLALLISHRFSYYITTTALGINEIMTLTCLGGTLYLFVRYMKTSRSAYIVGVIVLQTIAVHSHERYIGMTPFVILAIAFVEQDWHRKFALSASSLVPFCLFFFVKVFFVGSQFLIGTGGRKIEFAPLRFVENFAVSVSNLAGVNVGAPHLVGVPFAQVPLLFQFLQFAEVLTLGFLTWTLLRNARKEGILSIRHRFTQTVLCLAILMGSMIGSFCVTIRIMQYWILGPYVVCMFLICWGLVDLGCHRQLRWGMLTLCLLALPYNFYFRTHMGPIFYGSWRRVANRTYEAMVGARGDQLLEHNTYIVAQEGSLFRQILDNSQLPDRNIVLRQFVDFEDVLGSVHYLSDLSAVPKLSDGDLVLLHDPKRGVLLETTPAIHEGHAIAPRIEAWGPQQVAVGQAFNVQPNGQSAMWLRVYGLSEGTGVLLDGVALRSLPSPSRNTITCLLPLDVLQKAGCHSIVVADLSGGNPSAPVPFAVGVPLRSCASIFAQ